MYVHLDISCMFHTARTAWGENDPKEHQCYKMGRGHLKTYNHVKFVFTLLSTLN